MNATHLLHFTSNFQFVFLTEKLLLFPFKQKIYESSKQENIKVEYIWISFKVYRIPFSKTICLNNKIVWVKETLYQM